MRKSAILLIVIITLIFLSVMGMNLLAFLFSRTTIGILAADRLKAFYLAESGIAKALYELKNNVDCDKNGLGNVAAIKLGAGTFSAQHNAQTYTITAVGQVNNSKRVVQIKYTVL